MEYLVLQISTFLVLAVTIGLAIGWWTCKFIYSRYSAECQHELSGLRRNYEDIAKENATLRLQLRQLEQGLRKLSASPSAADYGEYLETRKTLEATRRQYEGLLERLHQQEKTLGILHKQLKSQQQELDAHKQASANQSVEKENIRAVTLQATSSPDHKQSDDLTLIQGINQKLASKLQALGIITYRQIAEFTKDDVHSIQKVIGNDTSLPLEEWTQTAHSLFQAKYCQPQA
ncbi:MAG: hypothetical protein KJ914_03360 [Gammaproteobacteria bacterium]|nr:hypothetical protein [Gammaproteobacteria bacterium]MBU1725725.1 hypothetical protein [Gammaproteobacteria bacterium]MBU2003923.1 hypothetical protein [Gammaproteobacteria bacterium]